MSLQLEVEKIGLAEAMQHLKNKGYKRIEKSHSKSYDLDAWKNGIKHLFEVKTRTMKRIAPSMTLSTREFELFKNKPNALLIMVCLDKNTKTAKHIKEYEFKEVKKFEISEYRVWF